MIEEDIEHYGREFVMQATSSHVFLKKNNKKYIKIKRLEKTAQSQIRNIERYKRNNLPIDAE